MRAPLGPLPLGQLGRRAEADATRKVLGPRAQPALVPTAVQQGMQVQRLVDDQGADTLGAVDFMGGEAHGWTPLATKSTGTFPKACTASQCITAPAARAAALIAATSCITPVSLLAHITETSRVSGFNAAARDSAVTRP